MNPSVVIHDFDVINMTVAPCKANAPLVVYSDAVLAFAVTAELFKTIRGRHTQIVHADRSV